MKLPKQIFCLKARSLATLTLGIIGLLSSISPAFAAPPRNPDKEETCDILVAGGGLAGAATAYEGLLAGRTVCVTEITDWVGGQISSQGTSALDERDTQRSRLFFPRGYLELRRRIEEHYGRLNPGGCWVSYSCFMPYNGHKLLFEMLQSAASRGNGTLKWYPNTVIKELAITPAVAANATGGQQIKSAIASNTNQQQIPRQSTPKPCLKLSKMPIATKILGDLTKLLFALLPNHKTSQIQNPDLLTGTSSMPLKQAN